MADGSARDCRGQGRDADHDAFFRRPHDTTLAPDEVDLGCDRLPGANELARHDVELEEPAMLGAEPAAPPDAHLDRGTHRVPRDHSE
jgi:hypothetical protein